jgi:hypothetical protein
LGVRDYSDTKTASWAVASGAAAGCLGDTCHPAGSAEGCRPRANEAPTAVLSVIPQPFLIPREREKRREKGALLLVLLKSAASAFPRHLTPRSLPRSLSPSRKLPDSSSSEFAKSLLKCKFGRERERASEVVHNMYYGANETAAPNKETRTGQQRNLDKAFYLAILYKHVRT